jgi:hypothetical protein
MILPLTFISTPRSSKSASLGIAVIAARSVGIKSDKIMAKMQLGSAEDG